MKPIYILPSFERSIKRLSSQEKKQLAKSLEFFNYFLVTGKSSSGFRFKKINHNKYEFRAGIKLRVIVKEESEGFALVLAGNHDEIRRYLREYKNA